MPKANFQLERIRELIAIMRESGVTELSVELPDFKISLKREGAGVEEEARVVAVAPEPRAVGEEPELFPVIAPMVGIFRSATDHSAKVSPGDSVRVGQVIGAIEVMKVPNDVLSPVSGVAREVLAADGAAVEYGQPLMLIEPLAAGEGVEIEAEAI